MIESVRLDIAGVITAISLVITAVATFVVAMRDKKTGGNSSNDKAIAVTQIADTDKKVETLIQQVDFLFDEISRLRTEKDTLERQVDRLTDELHKEREDHKNTKQRLDALLVELDEKNKKIAVLEHELAKLKENK